MLEAPQLEPSVEPPLPEVPAQKEKGQSNVKVKRRRRRLPVLSASKVLQEKVKKKRKRGKLMTTLNLDERQSTEVLDLEDVDTEATEEVVVPEVKSAKTKAVTPGSVEKSKEPSESELFFDFDEFPLDSFNSTMTSQTDTTCTDVDESDVSKMAGGSVTDKLQLTSDDEAEEDDVISKELSTDVTAIDENLVLRLELSPSKSLPSGSRSDAALTPGRDVISDAEEEELPSLSRSEVRDTSDSSLIDFNSTAQTLGSTPADQEDDAGDEEKVVRGEVAEEESEMDEVEKSEDKVGDETMDTTGDRVVVEEEAGGEDEEPLDDDVVDEQTSKDVDGNEPEEEAKTYEELISEIACSKDEVVTEDVQNASENMEIPELAAEKEEVTKHDEEPEDLHKESEETNISEAPVESEKLDDVIQQPDDETNEQDPLASNDTNEETLESTVSASASPQVAEPSAEVTSAVGAKQRRRRAGVKRRSMIELLYDVDGSRKYKPGFERKTILGQR